MQRSPLFEAKCFIYWKNRFETYVKSKDINLWHIIVNGDYKPIITNLVTGKEEAIPYDKLKDENKKMLSKNDDAKMALYNVLLKKEYEKIFLYKAAKDIWNSLVITHHDELIGNLKVYEVVFEKDSEVSKSFVGGCWSDSDEDDDPKKDEICLMAHDSNEVRLKVKLESNEWIKDSDCSRHMTSNKDLFSTYEAINRGNVVFSSNTKSKIIGKGQICDKKCKVLFSETGSKILKDDITIGRGIRKNGLYVMKIGNSPKDSLCLTSIDDTLTLWHRRLGHANMRLI
ncbi:retrovirus-related pol polyprotein from transposon TNT 1-94 [Tanacetum coccineum]|uniref:Retrovirus-related pol polyprotein from transposon TNT 1-94 n=1 Tax=Tanacetum coccineum TaxID=301880 RepID=A0ABQ4ZY13_9ASTR